MKPMQISTFLLIAIAVSCLLVACGGPSSPRTPVQVSFYGDSITSGAGLSPTPVERRTELAAGAFVGVDYSFGGATVQDASRGDPRLPFPGPFAEWIKRDASPIVVIGHAGANALRYADRIDEYDTLLTAMVGQAHAIGKTVLLAGMTWVAMPVAGVSETDSVRILQALAEFDDRTEAIAIREGVPFLDLRSVPFTGLADMLDNVHPNQAYADRVSAYVATRLMEILEMLHG